MTIVKTTFSGDASPSTLDSPTRRECRTRLAWCGPWWRSRGSGVAGCRWRCGPCCPIIIFVLWWVLTDSGVIGATALSSPGTTWSAFVTLLLHQDLMGDIGVSVTRAGFGLSIGGGVGLILGIVVGLFTLGEELFDSTMQMVRTIPYPALIFPFIIWFGIGETAKVLLIAYATLIPDVHLHVQRGAQCGSSSGRSGADRSGSGAAASSGRWSSRSPSRPSSTGCDFRAGVSVVALVFAETINANQGIGYLVSQASSLQQVPNLVVCIFIYALLGISADVLVRIIERVSMPWRRQPARPMSVTTTDAPAVVVRRRHQDLRDPRCALEPESPGPAGEFVALLGRVGERQDHALRILLGLTGPIIGRCLRAARCAPPSSRSPGWWPP